MTRPQDRRRTVRLATSMGLASVLALSGMLAAVADTDDDLDQLDPEQALVQVVDDAAPGAEPAEVPAEETSSGTGNPEDETVTEAEDGHVGEPAPVVEAAATDEGEADVVGETSDDASVADDGDFQVMVSSVELIPASVTQRRLAEGSGVTFHATGIAPGTETTVRVGTEVVATLGADDSGVARGTFNAMLAAGTHTVTVEAGGLSASAALTVEQGGYDTHVIIDEREYSEWEMGRRPVSGRVIGFPGGMTVQVLVNGQEVGQLTMSDDRSASFSFTADLPVGEHTISVESMVGGASAPVRVVADDEFYPGTHDLRLSADRLVVTASELAAEPVTLHLSDYPASSPVDIVVGGDVVDSVVVNSIGNAQYPLDSLAVGSHTIAATHAVGSASITLDVVPDDQGTPAPAGTFTGTATQTHASSSPYGPETRPFSFTIDAAGNLSGVTGEYWWACVTGGYHGSGYANFSEVSLTPTPITVGQPFEITWESTSTEYTLYGTVNADGSASGRAWASIGICGSSILDWTVQGDGDYTPAPTPTPSPTPAPDPTPTAPGTGDGTGVTAPGSVAPGEELVLTTTGVAPGTEVAVWLFSDPVYLGSHVVAADGTVTVTIPADATPGDHRVAVYVAGELIGWADVRILGDAGPPGGGGGTAPGLPSSGVSDDRGTMGTGAVLMLLGVAGALVRAGCRQVGKTA